MALPAIVAIAARLGIAVGSYLIKQGGKKVLKSGGEKALKKAVSKKTSEAKRDIRRESRDRNEIGFQKTDARSRRNPEKAKRDKIKAESRSRKNQKYDSQTLVIAQGKKRTAKWLKENRDRGFERHDPRIRTRLGIKDK